MTLLSLIKDKYKVVSIIGLAKNTGKTTTLNHLIKEANSENLPLGITSIGRDGEPLDLVTETEKPKIQVENGVIVATTTELMNLGTAKLAVLQVTDFRTAIGNVIIGKVKAPGTIQIAGPQSLIELKEIVDIMLDLGAELVLVDGAIDRRSSASPLISQAAVLSSGAVISKDMNKVIDETSHAIKIIKLPMLSSGKDKELIKDVLKDKKIALIDDELNVDVINLKTALGGGKIISSNIKSNTRYLVIPGSLVTKTIDELIESNKHRNIDIVVRDSTKVFIRPKDFERHIKLGVRIKVMESINLVGLTLNPTSPKGHSFESREFVSNMKSEIEDVPIMDLFITE